MPSTPGLRAELDRQTSDSRRLFASQRALVANVSHELKTPLTAIRGAAETLADGALDEEQAARRFLTHILNQCGRLESLVRDLLTLSRFESTTAEVERTLVELVPLVEHAVEVLRTPAEAHEVEITVDAEGSPVVRGETAALERLVLNLLDNAVKYNRPGGCVRMSVRRHGDAAQLEVADTGIGIPNGALDRVFERFYRVDSARAREQGGHGLGLAIVRQVAESHGGTAEVESRLGRGSVFRVRLPSITTPADTPPAASR